MIRIIIITIPWIGKCGLDNGPFSPGMIHRRFSWMPIARFVCNFYLPFVIYVETTRHTMKRFPVLGRNRFWMLHSSWIEQNASIIDSSWIIIKNKSCQRPGIGIPKRTLKMDGRISILMIILTTTATAIIITIIGAPLTNDTNGSWKIYCTDPRRARLPRIDVSCSRGRFIKKKKRDTLLQAE